MSGIFAGVLIGSYPVAGGPTAYRYFRITVDAASNPVRIPEIYLSDDGGSTLYPQSIGNMTAASSPSPLVASASSTSGSFEPWKAFDGNEGAFLRWSPNSATGEWIQIDLGSGNEILPNWLNIIGATGSDFVITDGSLLASNTGIFSGEEVELVNWSGNTSLDQVVTW